MLRQMLKAKIHRATITEADLNYEGSLTIDRDLLEALDITPFERIKVYNINNGERFDTYAIEGPSGSGVIVPIIVCLSALPIAPSGLGVRENLYVMMLGATGAHVEPKAALSLSLLAFAGSLCWSVVGGFVYMGKRERERLFEIGEAGTFADGS